MVSGRLKMDVKVTELQELTGFYKGTNFIQRGIVKFNLFFNWITELRAEPIKEQGQRSICTFQGLIIKICGKQALLKGRTYRALKLQNFTFTLNPTSPERKMP